MSLPQDEQDWLQANCQVHKGDKLIWMKRATLKKRVIAGKADDWMVVAIDPETGNHSIICPYCATGVEHRGSFH
jgi:hypothetical protein